MRCSGFPGKRVEFQRAGMIPTALFIQMIKNDLCRISEVGRNPICDASGHVVLKSSLNADRAYAGVATAFGVNLLIANKK
jgi:hypothetical protein